MTLQELALTQKYVVIKIDDLKKYVKSPFKIAMLDNDLQDITAGRKADGKKPHNEYIIINTDEPYAQEVADIIKRHEQQKLEELEEQHE
jgi:hypothetical protein